MKKLISIASVLMLLLSSFPFFSTQASAQELKLPSFSVEKNTEEHKVYKIEDETLEYFKDEDGDYYIATTDKGSFKIETINNNVTVTNIDTNEVVREAKKELVSESVHEVSTVQPVETNLTGSAIMPNNADPGGGTAYKHIRTRNMSLDIAYATVSIAAGMLASALGAGFYASSLTTIVSTIISLNLPKVYWKEHRYESGNTVYKYTKWVNDFYKYHDYTGFISSKSTILKSRVF